MTRFELRAWARGLLAIGRCLLDAYGIWPGPWERIEAETRIADDPRP